MILTGFSSRTLSRIVERMAKLSPRRHCELVRGMVAELDSIADPAERNRFALGAIAAISRLMLTGYIRAAVDAASGFAEIGNSKSVPGPGGPSMSKPTTWQLLRRHATVFVISIALLTGLLLANHAIRQVPQLTARGVPAGTIVEMLLLSLPYTLALTIPMAVFVAVSWVFARLGAEGVLASARQERHGVRRLVVPVLGAAAVIATLTLVSNTLVLPRANARLAKVIAVAPMELSDRTMTVGELREAARSARTSTVANAAARAAAYEVEIQKKFALAAACIFLALAGAAIAIRFPHGGMGVVLGSSGLVFTGYYFAVTAGEALADRQMISPLVAMWMANALLLGAVLLLVWRPNDPAPTRGGETLAIGG
jgi:lipopolysaccharide export LptBFGC system permease protein LptF